MSGWNMKPRSRFDHHLFEKEKFCRGYAWDWLCDNAAFKTITIDVKGRSVTLQRGQICHSIRFLATAWNWDKAAVSRFLTRLKTETMIETHTETGMTVITLCNYGKYNGDATHPETAPETLPETEVRQERDRSETDKNKDKKEKKEKKPAAASVSGSEDLFPEDTPAVVETPLAILSKVIDKALAADFIEHRRSLKKPLSIVAARRAVTAMDGFRDPAASINASILNGWSGLFDTEPSKSKPANQPMSGIMARVARRNGDPDGR